MTKRLNNKTTLRVTTNNHYLVTLSRLNNTYSGNPRYEANIICLDNDDIYCYTVVYRFNGHYMSEYDEAKWIINYYENNK